MCIAAAADESPVTVTSYRWNAMDCYNNSRGVNDPCFYSNGQTNQSITGNNLRAQDAGIVRCTATIGSTDYTSDPLTLRISGELEWYIHLLFKSINCCWLQLFLTAFNLHNICFTLNTFK